MNLRRSFILALVVSGVGSCLAVAATADNPYTPIVTRNVFGLVPIPVVDPASLAPVTPPPKITPNGIMTLFGKLQVLFKVAVAAPGQPPKDESYCLGEGERENEIEVQKIDEKAATITFNNHGTIQELALVVSKAATGGPAPASAGSAAAAGMPLRGVNPAMPGANPAVGFGGRFGRSRATPGGGSPGGSGAPGLGGAGAAQSGGINNPEQLSPEAQVLMMEANRMETQEAVNQGFMPPLPPTVITPEDATAPGGSPLIISPDPVQPPNKN